MSKYVVRWSRKGDGIYDPVNYAKIEGRTKASALSKAKREVGKHTCIDVMMILTMKEYGEYMSERMGTIK